MNKFTRFLSFALALTLTFTSVDMNVFAAELNEAEPSIVKTEESTSEENTEKPSQQESSDAETSADQNKSDSNDDNKSNETTNTQEGEANPEEVQEEGEALVEEELEVEEAEEQEMLEAITAEDLQIEGYKVTKYTGTGGEVVIPEGITSIADYAFSNVTGITSITLPSTLTSIGYMSFSNCTNLKKIVIPSSTRKIGYKAFYVNNQVDTEVVIESKSLDVDSSVFEGRNLTSVKLPEGMVTLPQLFNNATFTTGYVLSIPASVTTITDYAFSGATGLKTVTFTGENLTTIGEYAFKNSSISEISLPSKVKTIKYQAFKNCVNLTNITLPEGLQEIKEEAFEAEKPVAGDTTVVIKGKNFQASFSTFSGRNLSNVTLPEGMVTLPCIFNNATFTPGYVLSIPASVTTIADYAFSGVTGLKTVTFTGENLTTIGEYAFKNSSISEISLPSKVKTIKYQAFKNCANLTNITLPEGLQEINAEAFEAEKPVAGDTTVVIKGKNFQAGYSIFSGRNLSNVTLPEGMVTLPSIFNNAIFTPGYVLSIPASVTTIADYAFSGVTGLKTVTFNGENLTTIGESAFKNSSITEISLPSKVKTLKYEAFSNCRSLEKVYLGANISDMGYRVFGECELAYFIITGSGKNTYNALIAQGIDKNRIVSTKSITYKLNGGVATGAYPAGYLASDGSIQIADPTRENYKFAGWFKDAKFTKPTEKSVNGVTTIDVSNQSGNITLYAKWEGPIYTVTLNPGVNATVAITSMEVYKNSTYGKYNDNTDKELPVPSATGKTFKGWFTADGDLVTADTKVTDEAKDQVLYAKYKNNVDTVEAPELLDSNGLTVLPTDEKTDITKFYFSSATADATIIYTVKAENGVASENTYSDGFALEAGNTYTITAYATKENWTDSPKNTWTVTVVDSVSAEDTPDLYKPEYEGKFWVVFQGAIYDETKVSTVYTGANVKLSGYQVYYGKKLLEENKDYKVSYKNNKKIAKYDEVNKKGASIAPTMIITGKGNTKGKLELHFNIEGNEDAVKLTNSNTTFELSESSFDYDGTAHTPAVKNLQIKATKKTEAVAIDAKSYTVSYEKNVAAGTAKVVVTMDGKEYFGVLTKNFKINKTDIKNAIEGDKPLVAIEKSNKVSYNNGYNALKSIKNTKTGNDLVLKSEYTISKATVNSKTMTATQTITGKGSFKGSYKITFDVEKADIKDANVVSFVAPVASTKKGVYKPVAFKVLFDGTPLKGSEYSVKYTVNGQAPSNKVVYSTDAKVVMTITGKGNYVGTKTFEYSPVAGYDISDAAIIDVTVSDAAYTGKANGVNPSIVVKNTYTNKKLANKKDYTVSYKYANETEIKRTAKKKACDYVAEAGEAVKAKDTVPAGTTIIAVIEGKGAYAGKTIEREFRVGYDLSKASVKINPQTYTGKQIIPSKNDITVKVAGKELKANEYNVTIANVENVKAGTGKIIITGTNTSSKQKVVNFRIVARTLSLMDKN